MFCYVFNMPLYVVICCLCAFICLYTCLGWLISVYMYAYLYVKNRPEFLNKKVIAGNYSLKNLKNGFLPLTEDKNNVRYINKDLLDEFEIILKQTLQSILNNDFVRTTDIHR